MMWLTNARPQDLPGRRLRWIVPALAAVLVAARPVRAHAVFMTYIHHRVKIVVGPANIDVQIELTFYEVRSMSERRRMDADHNGTLSPAEVGDYLQRLAPSLAESVRLTIDGRPVDLVPLYDPELDLLGIDQIAPCHHLLRLFYFARTPKSLAPGSEIVVEDRLWPQVSSICMSEAAGHDGFRLAVDSASDEPYDAATDMASGLADGITALTGITLGVATAPGVNLQGEPPPPQSPDGATAGNPEREPRDFVRPTPAAPQGPTATAGAPDPLTAFGTGTVRGPRPVRARCLEVPPGFGLPDSPAAPVGRSAVSSTRGVVALAAALVTVAVTILAARRRVRV